MKVLLIASIRKSARFPDVPIAPDLAKTPQAKQALELILSPDILARPYLAPPHLPVDRLTALRKAFDQTMIDPAYLADAKKAKLDVDPLSGVKLQAYVEQLVSLPPSSVKLLTAALSDKGLFDCAKLVNDKSLCEQPGKKAKED